MDSTSRRESDLSLPEGLEAGLIGGLVVVVAYLVPDLLAGDWLRTPSLLGALLFGSDSQPTPSSSGGLAAAFTVVHFGAWAVAGFAGSALMRLVERRSRLRRLPLVVFVLWIGAMVALDLWMWVTDHPATHVWVGSLAAGFAVVAYLVWRHPTALAQDPAEPGSSG